MTYTIDEKKVIYADLDPKEGVVLNLNTKNYYRLNETAQVIWQDLAAKRSIDEIVLRVTSEFDTTAADARHDVQNLIEEFHKERLVETVSTSIPAFDVEAARKSKKGR